MVRGIRKFKVRFEPTPSDLQAKLQPLGEEVLKRFPKLPPLRLLCYFDAQNPEWLQHRFGEFTGIHTPVIGGGTWPEYVSKHFLSSSGEFAFDDLIYIPNSGYVQQKVPFTIVLAHEIQHFVQRGFTPRIAKANALLLWNLTRFDPNTELKPWGLPNNREAMIVARHVAESICGKGAVDAFVLAQVKDGETKNNVSKAQLWRWASTLTPSTRFNLLKETDKFVQKYRQQLQSLKSDIDFSKPKWWL